MTVTDYLTIYEYRCEARACQYRFFSMENVGSSARCPKCWWWSRSAPSIISRPDWLVDPAATASEAEK